MAEMERTRERERGTIAESPYEMLIRSRREFLERQEKGQVVIRPADREFYLTRQGRLMYHLNPEIHKETPLQDWRVFSHDLKTQSGKHRHQGGLVIYVITGKGYSVVDGERVEYHWTFTGTSADTGQRVRIPGFEEWTLDPDGRIASSQGHYDEAEYERQLREGAER